MVVTEHIARETLIIGEDYPFQHWMFVWNGEVIRVDISESTDKIFTSLGDTAPEEELLLIKKFIDATLEEEHGKPDPKNRD